MRVSDLSRVSPLLFPLPRGVALALHCFYGSVLVLAAWHPVLCVVSSLLPPVPCGAPRVSTISSTSSDDEEEVSAEVRG